MQQNLALSLGKKEKVIVFADRHHFFYDSLYDNKSADSSGFESSIRIIQPSS